MKRFYEEDKERNEQRIKDEKTKAQRKFDMNVEEYEERINDLNANHEDAMSALLDEKAALEHQLMGS